MEGVGMSGANTGNWQGRSVLITGHTGFKGSWLSLWLTLLGARVAGYALPPARSADLFSAACIAERIGEHGTGDVQDLDALRSAVRRSRPEVIFHLAAQSLVREGYRMPRDTFGVNVMGTVNLLDVVRELGRSCVVIVVTSDKCYENRGVLTPHTESDALGGSDPYSASKAAAELVVAAYRQSCFPPEAIGRHGVKLASVRAGNVIGGGDWAADRIIPDCVRAVQAGEAVGLRNPQAIRPWQHVLEPLYGYLLLADRMLTEDGQHLCTAWNFGPDSSQNASVRDLVEEFLQAWGGGSWRNDRRPDPPKEEPVLRLDSTQAERHLGWRGQWDWREAIRRTVNWYRQWNNGQGAAAGELCADDIAAFAGASAGSRCEVSRNTAAGKVQ